MLNQDTIERIERIDVTTQETKELVQGHERRIRKLESFRSTLIGGAAVLGFVLGAIKAHLFDFLRGGAQ